MALRDAIRVAALGASGLLLVACAAPAAPVPEPTPTPEAPAPPAACLIDPAALAMATGVGWTSDSATASDTRCVYDPAGSDPSQFVVVEVEPDVELDVVMQVCADDDEPLLLADGFVCRIGAGGVFAAGRTDGRVVTIAAAVAPVGDPPRLVDAFADELARLAG